MAMYLEFAIPGPPLSNQPRTSRAKASLRRWQAAVSGEARNRWTNPVLVGALKAVLINFHAGETPSVDLDNMSKPILDCLQGVVYHDDRQIRQAKLAHLSLDFPRPLFGVSPVIVDALKGGGRNSCTSGSKIRSNLSHYPDNIMETFEDRLVREADRYRQQGYQVVIRPGEGDLPGFAKGFRVEILATRDEGGVLATAKETGLEFETDPNLTTYAEIIEKQPRWRYDVFVLGPAPQAKPERADVMEASPDEVSRSLSDAERLVRAGFEAQAVIAAWAALESAMRQRLRAEGRKAGLGSSTQGMMNEVLDLGGLTFGELRALEAHLVLRDAIAHGFSPPPIGSDVVPFLVAMARCLLEPVAC